MLRLAAEIAPGSRAADLGGVMSLNARLEPAGLVLRVHQPFVSRRRLLAVHEVPRRLAGLRLVVPIPLSWRGSTVLRCGHRWAELEAYHDSERPEASLDSYTWLFGAMGALHRALATLDLAVPRPVVSTYAPPGSLRRWLPVTEAAVRDDPEAAAVARLLRDLIGHLRAQWIPAARLPAHLVHGDVRLSNVRRTPGGEALYLDFGFLARRSRVHDLAYALAFMVPALGGHEAPEYFVWGMVPELVKAYEAGARSRTRSAGRWCPTPPPSRSTTPP